MEAAGEGGLDIADSSAASVGSSGPEHRFWTACDVLFGQEEQVHYDDRTSLYRIC